MQEILAKLKDGIQEIMPFTGTPPSLALAAVCRLWINFLQKNEISMTCLGVESCSELKLPSSSSLRMESPSLR